MVIGLLALVTGRAADALWPVMKARAAKPFRPVRRPLSAAAG